MAKEHRGERLAAAIQRGIAQQLQLLYPGDHVTVTEVEMAKDAKFAIIWVSILDSSRRETVFADINSRQGQLRSAITKAAEVRRLPQIEFKLDFRGERAQEIDRLTKS